MSDSSISQSRKKGYRQIGNQDQPAGTFDLNSIRPSNGGTVRDEVTVTETLGVDDNRKRHKTQPKANIGYHSFVSSPTVVMAVFTLAALAICLGIISSLVRNKASYKSSSLIGHGGSFIQPQAKILDLIASAIIAPILMALFNLYCFKSARASAVNEKSGLLHSLTLRTLVEVSTTTCGSYDPFKVLELGKVKQARLLILALLTLASAISLSALSNFVAYEAFIKEAGTNTNASLQYLYRRPEDTPNVYTPNVYTPNVYTPNVYTPNVYTPNVYSQMPLLSTKEQQAQFTSQWFQVLTALSYSPAGPFLDPDYSYIGINMTNASLARLPSETTTLFAVPAYKLNLNCQPATPTNAVLVTMGSINQVLSISFSAGSITDSLYKGDIKNGASAILSSENGDYQFLAFEGLVGPTASVVLGNIESFNTSNSTSITSFGPLSHYAFNNTLTPLSGDLGTKIVLSVWGINCTLTRQQGTVDMHRSVNGTIADWRRSQFTPLLSPLDKKEPLFLIAKDLQVSPAYVAPEATIPGLGGALALSSNIGFAAINHTTMTQNEDFDPWVKNFLYAEGEARRIAYEVALQNPVPGIDDSGLAYTVAAQSAVLKYRMTYIPWILLVGLSTLATAGILVLGLKMMAGRGVGKMRVLTPLRVVVDAGIGLEINQLAAELMDDEDIGTWAKEVRVRYVRADDAEGEPQIRLKEAIIKGR